MTTASLALLSPAEITEAVALVKAKGLVGERTTFRRMAVDERDLSERRLEIWLYHGETKRIEELIVSMSTGEVVTSKMVEGMKPQIGFAEIPTAQKLVREDPRVKEAAARRGIDDTGKLQIDPWPTGNMGLDHEEGRRVVRCIAFYREESDDNGYARPVDGIMAWVDLDLMEVYRVEDIDTWPLAAKTSNFSAGTVPERTDVKPLEITQPDGPSFTITDGNHIHWQKWDVKVLLDHTEGLVLHSLGWTDGDIRRPIMWRASLAEMVVPYGETRETQAFKNALDIGEIALGRCVNSLKLGCDCLGDITYLDGAWCFDDGSPIHVEQAICIHEEDFGIAWKHTDSHAGNTDVRRSRRLVISSIFTVGNYDYGIFWYLYVDGTIQLEVKLTGIVTTQSHRDGDDLTYAALVDSEVAAPIHQHLFCARFDMEVDGPNNTAYRVDVVPDPPGPDNPHNNAFRAVPTRLDSEQQAIDVVDASTARTWRVVNEAATNGIGNPTGFKLLPADTSTLFPSDASRIAGRAGFATKNIWVTPTSSDERFPAGDHVTQSEPNGQGLPRWTAADRSLVDTDITVWHTFGLTHSARPEDYPVMPVEYARCTWVPFGFFDRNPALDLPAPEHCH
ncbi:MAG: primary-amine oxidase [Acidimicrobiales bacterium]